MKKMFAVVVMVFVFAMTGMTSMAAEINRQYEDYRILIEGLDKDLDALGEDEDVTYISVEKKEFPRERVCIYNVKLTSAEGDFTVHYYINGETEEVYATVFDSDGEVVESEVETLSEAADFYRE